MHCFVIHLQILCMLQADMGFLVVKVEGMMMMMGVFTLQCSLQTVYCVVHGPGDSSAVHENGNFQFYTHLLKYAYPFHVSWLETFEEKEQVLEQMDGWLDGWMEWVKTALSPIYAYGYGARV